VPETPGKLPDFVAWPSFPFEGDLKIKPLEPVAQTEPPRDGEDAGECAACNAKDEAYIWVSERWRVRALDQPSGLPMVLILESRSHLDLGDLPNLLAAELGVMTVRLERAIRSLDGVARVHVNRWGDGAAHLHLWFFARPVGRLQLRGSFLSMWDDILPPISEETWRENLALVAAWLAEFGGRPLAEPPRIAWQAPATLAETRPFAIDEADDEADDEAESAGTTAAGVSAASADAARSAEPTESAATDATGPVRATDDVTAGETNTPGETAAAAATGPTTATAEARTDELIELPAPREPESPKQKTAAPASA
jgi:hypothetical protein